MLALRHLEPARDIRTEFQYNNLAYNVAGLVAERVSGQSYEEFIRTRLTDKLRMPVGFSAEEHGGADDAAVPYLVERDDERQRSKFFPIPTTAAGAITTSVAALANWMKFLLAEGEFEGPRLLSPELIREMQMPRAFTRPRPNSTSSVMGTTGWASLNAYRGERVVGHSGGWLGWSTLMRLVPDASSASPSSPTPAAIHQAS